MSHKSIWTTKLETDLIDLLQPTTILWDNDDPLYKKTRQKKIILIDFTQKLCKRWPQFAKEINTDSVLKKINSLKSYYRKEIRKIKNLKQSGIPYSPHWEHFSRLKFLGDLPDIKQSAKKMNTFEETKGPTIVSLNHNCKSSENFEFDEESDNIMKWQPPMNPSEEVNLEKSSVQNQSSEPNTENIDHMFGHFVISIMKSIPESKMKDEIRMKIIQELFNLKNS